MPLRLCHVHVGSSCTSQSHNSIMKTKLLSIEEVTNAYYPERSNWYMRLEWSIMSPEEEFPSMICWSDSDASAATDGSTTTESITFNANKGWYHQWNYQFPFLAPQPSANRLDVTRYAAVSVLLSCLLVLVMRTTMEWRCLHFRTESKGAPHAGKNVLSSKYRSSDAYFILYASSLSS